MDHSSLNEEDKKKMTEVFVALEQAGHHCFEITERMKRVGPAGEASSNHRDANEAESLIDLVELRLCEMFGLTDEGRDMLVATSSDMD